MDHKYRHKLNKYLHKIKFISYGGKNIIKIGTYTQTCSNNKGNKLNKIGLEKYLNYKKGSCGNLGWEVNSCKLTNNLNKIKSLAEKYISCAEDRENFSNMCVVNIDSNHQHAIDRMDKYGKECEEKLNSQS